MGHLGDGSLERLFDMADGMDNYRLDGECICKACVQGRMKGRPHNSRLRRGEHTNFLIHSDIAGPIDPPGFDGSQYLITILDDYDQCAEIVPLRHRSDGSRVLINYMLRNVRPELPFKFIHFDRAGENRSEELTAFALDKGIVLEYTDTEQHQANGCAEVLNDKVETRLMPTMLTAGLDPRYWPPVVQFGIAYLRDRSPTSRLDCTPFEMRSGLRPNLAHVRKIGSAAFVLKPSAKRKRHAIGEPKTHDMKLLGFKSNSTYIVTTPSGGWTERTDVVFEEHWHHHGAPAPAESTATIESGGNTREVTPPVTDDIADTIMSDTAAAATAIERQQATDQGLRRPRFEWQTVTPMEDQRPHDLGARLDESHIIEGKRQRRPTQRLHLLFHVIMTANVANQYTHYILDEPKTLEEAQARFDWSEWKKATDAEVASLRKNVTWRLKRRTLVNGKVLRGKWVFKIKLNPDGSINKYKARWVVRGFEQEEGGDFNEVFAPTVKPMSYKLLFALAAAFDWEIEQMDVATAFLYGNVEEDVFVEQPHGYEEGDGEDVCHLHKALYGLKQSPRIWYKTLAEYLESIGYTALSSDMSVFIRDTTIVAVYVDDILIIGPNKKQIENTKKALGERFNMTDLGPCYHYLGMTVCRDRKKRIIHLGQKTYIQRFLEEHGFWSEGRIGSTDTPMSTTANLQPAPDNYHAPEDLRKRYQRVVGSLMYAMLGTRPDIAYSVSVVSRFASNPTEQHWTGVKRILRYLRTTIDYQLVFNDTFETLTGFTDASWGDDASRRSTSGYLFSVGSAVISWQSKRQPTVALSTCEAEFVGQTHAAKEAIWLRDLLRELGHEQLGATVIYGDNAGAVALSRNPQYHSRTKHIGIQHAWQREKVEDGVIDVQWIETKKQTADGLTKPLPKAAFAEFRHSLGLRKETDI